MNARIIANIYDARTLAGLRDALLPKLLSGELRVPGKSQSYLCPPKPNSMRGS